MGIWITTTTMIMTTITTTTTTTTIITTTTKRYLYMITALASTTMETVAMKRWNLITRITAMPQQDRWQ